MSVYTASTVTARMRSHCWPGGSAEGIPSRCRAWAQFVASVCRRPLRMRLMSMSCPTAVRACSCPGPDGRRLRTWSRNAFSEPSDGGLPSVVRMNKSKTSASAPSLAVS